MENEDYVTVRERQKNAFSIRLKEALKQYSVVKVNDVDGAHHGEDYKEMKRVIMETFFDKD